MRLNADKSSAWNINKQMPVFKKILRTPLSTFHLDAYYVAAAICPLSNHSPGGSMVITMIWSVISYAEFCYRCLLHYLWWKYLTRGFSRICTVTDVWNIVQFNGGSISSRSVNLLPYYCNYSCDLNYLLDCYLVIQGQHYYKSGTRRRSWECISLPSEFLQTPPFRKILRGHVWNVAGNKHVKFEILSFNRFGAISF